jgi:hypothetical protein
LTEKYRCPAAVSRIERSDPHGVDSVCVRDGHALWWADGDGEPQMTIEPVTISVDAVVDHVQELQRRSDRLDAIMERASRGLDFAMAQQELTKGFPNAAYWEGKEHGYRAILEIGFGLDNQPNTD